ncbi:FAD-dependent oxidoreductase [Mycolicibacterium sp. 018/SC-01/001]|uniref:NAD(P)/FAD-dependent oxidoreductase n=1 Tax=Mycolicibacterium sp. 018/SC-01/001 TaxID=2592069 RepID=UPI0011802804|nr:FAD-binding oxidoreductase [Mycolicibacterium sp. 018/SC-01/001]TRW80982.1 FAD-dependent oxidoreductase [Mycolicibacterium sp. 018/SC-01/001]
MTIDQTAYERNAPDPRLVDDALQPSEHRVFWLEDAGQHTTRPALTASTTADLTIIGGGYLGLWTAVHAKRRNPAQRVVLLESHTLGWAASGRNGGFCEASITHGDENGQSRWPDEFDALHQLGRDNLDEFETDVTSLGLDCHWERTGQLAVAVEHHQVPWLQHAAHPLDQTEVRAEINSPLFLAGARDDTDCALIHPARLVFELARTAEELGVEIFENSAATALRSTKSGAVSVHTDRATVTTQQVALATNVFRSLLRRNRLMTVPVYDYVLMTEPLSQQQMDSIGWCGRQGLTDLANQFHYSRLTHDNRILYGGYDAVFHRGGQLSVAYEDRSKSYRRLASHFLATFPQLEGITFTHRWGGAVDTCTQFAAFYGLARGGKVAYAAGFTGLGVGATRFAANVMLDQLTGHTTARTSLAMTTQRPLPFPPEPLASIGINLTRWSLDRADHNQGRRNLLLKALDAAGLGFDS